MRVHKILMYLCWYEVRLLSSHSSVPSLSLFSQAVNPDRNWSSLNLGKLNPKRNNSSSKTWRNRTVRFWSRNIYFRFHPSPFVVLLSSHPSVSIFRNQTQWPTYRKSLCRNPQNDKKFHNFERVKTKAIKFL